ncbi:MAG: hypothetical protein AAF610_02445 [Pseudomonadota bacterium]
MHRLRKRLLGVALASLTFAASANTITIDIDDIASWDAQGDGDNTVLVIDMEAGPSITGIGWDVTITPVESSWYSEATVGFGNTTDGNLVTLRPSQDAFSGDGMPRTYSSGGIIDLASAGVADIPLDDGLLILEFFDDRPGKIDALWSGQLYVRTGSLSHFVPLPGALWLLASGVCAVSFFRRT